MMNKSIIKYEKSQYIIIFIFFMHQIYFSLKVGTHWDEIGVMWAAGKFLEKLKLTILDFNNPLLGEYVFEEYYGVFASLPIHIFTRITYSFKSISEFLISTNLFVNEFDYFYFLRRFFLTIYVCVLLYFIVKNLKKNFSTKTSFWFVIFLVLYPSFNGHAMFNFTDIPLALNLFLATLVYLEKFKDTSRARLSTSEILIVSFCISSCVLIRATSVVFLIPLFIFSSNNWKKKNSLSRFVISNIKILITSLSIYIIGTPNMWRFPQKYISNILNVQFDNPWRGVTLTNGMFVDAANPTMSYLSTWFFYKTPIIILFFFLTFLFFIRRERLDNLSKYSIFLISYTFLLHIAVSPLTYNEIRHYLFLLPFITYIATSGFLFLVNNYPKIKVPLIFLSMIYLFITQIPYDQYKYSYLNEFASTEDMSGYCEEINGCGNWILDYWGTSGKESAEMLSNHKVKNLLICQPQVSTTIYMNHNKIDISNFWVFKNGIPVYNETSGFEQYKLIYSEGHFKDAIKNRNITEMHVHSIYHPHRPLDTCNFFEIQDEYNISCSLEDSVSRIIRGNDVYFSFLSKCSFERL